MHNIIVTLISSKYNNYLNINKSLYVHISTRGCSISKIEYEFYLLISKIAFIILKIYISNKLQVLLIKCQKR